MQICAPSRPRVYRERSRDSLLRLSQGKLGKDTQNLADCMKCVSDLVMFITSWTCDRRRLDFIILSHLLSSVNFFSQYFINYSHFLIFIYWSLPNLLSFTSYLPSLTSNLIKVLYSIYRIVKKEF